MPILSSLPTCSLVSASAFLGHIRSVVPCQRATEVRRRSGPHVRRSIFGTTDSVEDAILYECDGFSLHFHYVVWTGFFFRGFSNYLSVFVGVVAAFLSKYARLSFANVGTCFTCLSKFDLYRCCVKNAAVMALVCMSPTQSNNAFRNFFYDEIFFACEKTWDGRESSDAVGGSLIRAKLDEIVLVVECI